MGSALERSGFEPWPHRVVFLGVTLQWTSIPSRGVEIFPVASCYKHRDKLLHGQTTWLLCRLNLSTANEGAIATKIAYEHLLNDVNIFELTCTLCFALCF